MPAVKLGDEPTAEKGDAKWLGRRRHQAGRGTIPSIIPAGEKDGGRRVIGPPLSDVWTKPLPVSFPDRNGQRGRSIASCSPVYRLNFGSSPPPAAAEVICPLTRWKRLSITAPATPCRGIGIDGIVDQALAAGS